MGKAASALLFMWVIISLTGSVLTGHVEFARTGLTAAISDAATTIPLRNTAGFPSVGIAVIESEHIAYSFKSTSTGPGNLTGIIARPLVRGAEGTTATAHALGKSVATNPGAWFNQSLGYNIAAISDAAGLTAFISVPVAVFALFINFLTVPLQFLGTDLQILTIIWGVVVVGFLIALTIAMAGGRRMS